MARILSAAGSAWHALRVLVDPGSSTGRDRSPRSSFDGLRTNGVWGRELLGTGNNVGWEAGSMLVRPFPCFSRRLSKRTPLGITVLAELVEAHAAGDHRSR